jgi:hypothetical protein
MAKQEVTGVQIQMAASAGVKLLQQDDLMVPLSVSKSGALSILESMLQALASGEVVLAQPAEQGVQLPTAGPNPEVAAAVAAAVQPPAIPAAAENNGGGDGEAPIAPVELEKKPA